MVKTMAWKPAFIGIGAEKSATTWAWTMLDEHPDVCMSQPKELNYFNVDDNFSRGDSWYRKHFSTHASCCGEISPLYMDDERVAERIKSVYPDTNILVMLRNPFDRALSHLFHDASVRYGTVADLTPDHLRSLAEKDPKYVRRSSYHTALKPFFDNFQRDQIGVFFFDDVKADGLGLAQQIYQLAGVDSTFVPEQFNRKVNESQDLKPLAGVVMGASRMARAFPPTRMALQWMYRNTRVREKVIQWLMVNKGRPEITFEDVFPPDIRTRLSDDLSSLQQLLTNEIPASWQDDTTASVRQAA